MFVPILCSLSTMKKKSCNKRSAMSAVVAFYFVALHALAGAEQSRTSASPTTTAAFVPFVGTAGRPRWSTTKRRREQRYHASMTTNGYFRRGGPAQQNGLVDGDNLNLITTPGIDRGGQLHVDPDVVCSATPPSAVNEAAFTTAVEGSPHFAHLLDGLEHKSTSLLQHFEPLERIVLTANGNLQRVISAYYDSPVTVEIKRSTEVGPRIFHREVTLSVLGQTCCVAKSVVVLHSPACVEVASRGEVGIGQLFRFLDVLPSFELLNAGRTSAEPAGGLAQDKEREFWGQGLQQGRDRPSGEGMWRVYDLRSRHLSCRIHEEFSPDLFALLTINGSGHQRAPAPTP